MKIKFLAFYDVNKSLEQRICPMSVKNVIDYIIDTLVKEGNEIEIISLSTTRQIGKYFPKRKERISENVSLTVGPTFHSKIRIFDLFCTAITRIWFVIYVLLKTKKGDALFVWHSIPMMSPSLFIYKMLKSRNPNFVFYVGELFQTTLQGEISNLRVNKENKFLKVSNKYILSTDYLKDRINPDASNILLPGVLSVQKDNQNRFSDKDNKVHLIYSGSINDSKGAFPAIEIAKYLNEKYVIHILGWPVNKYVSSKLENKINENNKKNDCKIIYDGILKGKEYDTYISKCDIGICSQDQNASYTCYSFPSKILAYLSNNLRVVSVDIPTLRNSKFSDLLYFVPTNDPQLFAEQIKRMDLTDKYNSKSLLRKMNSKFRTNLSKLLSK